MLRRLSVRGKILAALAVPVLVLFVAAAYIAGQAISQARVASLTHSLVEALPEQDGAIDALQAERVASDSVTQKKDPDAKAVLDQARTTTDDALLKRDRALRAIDTSSVDARVASAITGALTADDRVKELRRQVDASGATVDYLDQGYEAIISTTFEVQQTLADTISDRGLAQYVTVYNSVDQLVSDTTVETSAGTNLLIDAQGLGDSIAAAQNSGVLSRAVTMAGLVQADDTNRQDVDVELVQLGLSQVQLPAPSGEYQVLRNALAAANPSIASADSVKKWPSLSGDTANQYSAVRDQVRTATASAAKDVQSSATTRAAVTIGIALLALVLTVVIALAIARQIVRPLRRLTDAAQNVREELPNLVEQVAEPGRGPDLSLEEIPVESGDEVGQLARAFNDVNATTIQVAKEQAALRGSIAEMFVNVARRDQVLLNRQLSFLDDLERTEEDPGSLSNLFRLDHLATRMRRNAESLLVLAGIDSGRRVRQPMPTSDVIRTASSEIEMYDRVRLILPVDPMMLGHNALSSAHLLAELLENATRFSEPHTPVEVSTNHTSDGVQVIIRDYGLGMGTDELAGATSRVATSGATDVIGAQRLGLYVVGRLAGRLGARVQFTSTGESGQGTTAIVTFPTGLFASDSALPLPEPTDPLAADTQAAVHELTRGTGAAQPSQAPSRAATAPGGLPVRGGSSASTAAPLSVPNPAGAPAAGLLAEGYDLGEPEVVHPVDLDALTDGTTATGMPRRRTTRQEPSAPAAGTTQNQVILPPLATPDLPSVDLGEDDAVAWVPPAPDGTPSGSVLPSRHRDVTPAPVSEPLLSLALEPSAAAPHALPDDTSVDLVPVPDHVVASSMFRGFRPMSELEREVVVDPAEPEPVAAAPVVPEPVPAAPVVPEPVAAVPEALAYEPAPAAALPPAGALWEPELTGPAFVAQGVAPESLASDESEWAPQFSLGEPALPSRPEANQVEDAAPASAIWEPPAAGLASSPYSDLGGYFGDRPDSDPTPEVGGATAQAEDFHPSHHGIEQQDVVQHDDPFAQSLPPFDELLTNLPTRRDVREAARRNRGWFRRGYSQKAYADALATLSRPTPVVPASAIVSPEVLGLGGPRPATSVQPVAPGSAPEVQDYAPRPVEVRRAFEVNAAPLAPVAVPPVAPVAQELPVRQEPIRGAEPVVREPVSPQPQPQPQPQAQAQAQRQPDATRDYASDPVAAKSEWLASAVLYEEMTSLLRTSPDFTDGATPTGATYQPVVDLTTGPSLSRRARREQALTGELRVPDGIDRDAEVLRERLRAFQSGTRRAREDALSRTSIDLDAEFEAAFGGPTEGTGAAGDGNRSQY